MATPQVTTTRILRRLLASGCPRPRRAAAGAHAPRRISDPSSPTWHPTRPGSVIELLFRQHRAARAPCASCPRRLLPQIFEAVEDARLAQVLGRLEGLDDLLRAARMAPGGATPRGPRKLLPEAQASRSSDTGRALPRVECRPGDDHALRRPGREDERRRRPSIASARKAETSDAILYLYVVDEKGTLRGVVPIRRLVAAPPSRHVRRAHDRESDLGPRRRRSGGGRRASWPATTCWPSRSPTPRVACSASSRWTTSST